MSKRNPTRHETRTAALIESGGSRINLILSPESTAGLEKLTDKSGETRTAVIERLIRRAAARV